MIRYGYTITVAALFISTCCHWATAQTPREVAEKVMPSVVLIMTEDENRQPLMIGSGFAVAEGVVATNRHVIEGAAGGYARLVGEEAQLEIRGVLAVDEGADLVLLSVQGLGASALEVGDSSEIAVGDKVYAVGNPKGLEGTFSEGIVSGIRKVDEDSLFQITAPISPGSSGGPVLDAEGAVIGVAVATLKDGQNLNFAVPSRYLSKMIENMGPAKPLSPELSNRTETKAFAGVIGTMPTNGIVGAAFLWLSGDIPYGTYSLTLRNNLRHDVRDVRYLVIFYDRGGQVLDSQEHSLRFQLSNRNLRAGLAVRVNGMVDGSVQELTTRRGSRTPDTKFEIRVLDFEVAH